MDRRLGCKHRHHPLPYGRQDDDHLSEKGRGRICNTGRNSRANDSSTFGLPHRPTRHHRAPQPRNPGPQAREHPAEKHTQAVTTTQPRLISSISSVSSTRARALAVYRELILSPLGVASLYRVVVNCFQICIFAGAQTTRHGRCRCACTL